MPDSIALCPPPTPTSESITSFPLSPITPSSIGPAVVGSRLSRFFGRSDYAKAPTTRAKSTIELTEEAEINKSLVHELTTDLAQADEKLKEKAHDLRASRKACNVLQGQVQELKQQLQMLSTEMEKMAQSDRQSELEMSKLEMHKDSLKRQLLEAQAELQTKAERIASLLEVGNKLLEEKQSVEEEFEFAERTNADLQKQLGDLDRDLEHEKLANKKLQLELIETKDQNDFNKTRAAQHKRSLRAAEAEMEQLEEIYAAATQSQNTQDADDTDTVEELRRQIEKLSFKYDILKDAVKTKDERAALIGELINQVFSSLPTLETYSAEAISQKAASDKHVCKVDHENTKLTDQVVELRHDLDTQISASKDLQQKLTASEQALVIQREKAAQNAQITSIMYQEQTAHLNATICSQENKIQALELEVAATAEAASRTQDTLETRIASFEDDFRRQTLDLDTEREKANACLSWPEDQASKASLPAQDKRIAELKQALARLRQTARNAEARASGLAAEKVDLMRREEKVKQEVEDLQKKNQDLAAEITELKHVESKQENKIARLHSKYQNLLKMLAKQAVDKERDEKKINNLTMEVKKLNNAYKKQAGVMAKKDEKINELQAEIEQLNLGNAHQAEEQREGAFQDEAVSDIWVEQAASETESGSKKAYDSKRVSLPLPASEAVPETLVRRKCSV